jgi:hypothetical protein
MDDSAPQQQPQPNVQGPPIVVPAAGAQAPKAVTQPPPWGEGAVHIPPSPASPRMPRPAKPEPVEEISGSILLDDPEELSGSILVPDDEPPRRMPPRPLSQRPPAVSSKPPPPPARSKPPPPVATNPPPPFVPMPAPTPRPIVPHAAPTPMPQFAHAAPPAAPTPMPQFAQPAPAPATLSKQTMLGMAPVGAPPPAQDHPISVPPPAPFPSLNHTAAGPPSASGQRAVQKNEPASIPVPPQALTDGPPLPDGVPVPDWLPNPVHVDGWQPDVPQTTMPAPPPTERTMAPQPSGTDEVEAFTPEWQRTLKKAKAWVVEGDWKARLEKVESMIPGGKKPRWFLPVVGVAAVVVLIGIIGLISSLGGRKDSAAETKKTTSPAKSATAASITTTTSAVATSAPTPTAPPTQAATVAAPPPPPPPPSTPSTAACKVAGGSHVIAPTGIVAAGVEVVHAKDAIAIGFASSDKDALAVQVDPQSLTAAATARARAFDNIRRVTPMPGKPFTLAADGDKKADKVQGRRMVLADPPIDIGMAEGHLVTTAHGGGAPAKLWALEGDGPLEAARAVTIPGGDMAIAFRRAGAIWMGVASGNAPKGQLSKVPGLGPQVGSPAIAAIKDKVMVVWADRAAATDSWALRYVLFSPGEQAGAPIGFTPPGGGMGGHVMSPGLAAVEGDRFVLVWTEGQTSTHQVRALTLSPSGSAYGDPMLISAEGVNAGQAQVAVRADGQGVVAFLAQSTKNPKAFEVVATPIACGR